MNPANSSKNIDRNRRRSLEDRHDDRHLRQLGIVSSCKCTEDPQPKNTKEEEAMTTAVASRQEATHSTDTAAIRPF